MTREDQPMTEEYKKGVKNIILASTFVVCGIVLVAGTISALIVVALKPEDQDKSSRMFQHTAPLVIKEAADVA